MWRRPKGCPFKRVPAPWLQLGSSDSCRASNYPRDARIVCVGGHGQVVRSLTAGLEVREPFGPHPALFAESEGKVRWRSARMNPAVLPA